MFDRDGQIYKRQFASFGGACPYACGHCYTFSQNYVTDNYTDVISIVNHLNDDHGQTDIVYISGHKENFVIPAEGLDLCERIYAAKRCDILFTTRNVFNKNDVKRLSLLNRAMKKNGHDLFCCVSIPALQSFRKTERNSLIPSPEDRMAFLKQVYAEGIYTFLTLRPLFPDTFIPISEPLTIIDECKSFSTAVISSGLCINDSMLKRLEGFPKDFLYNESSLMKCLGNDIPMKFVDVTFELRKLQEQCAFYGVPFFCENNITQGDSVSSCAIEYTKQKSLRRNQVTTQESTTVSSI